MADSHTGLLLLPATVRALCSSDHFENCSESPHRSGPFRLTPPSTERKEATAKSMTEPLPLPRRSKRCVLERHRHREEACCHQLRTVSAMY